MRHKSIIEPFRVKMVEPINMTTETERRAYLKKAHHNLFMLHSKEVIIDLLTDSGTSAMSANQWAGIMKGDESYAGATSWDKMYAEINDLTGLNYILPTHQGRAAERILYSHLGGTGKIFISNTHFDTTRANIEFSGAEAIDIPIEQANNPANLHPFKGNMDIERLEHIITKNGAANIGAVILTLTNNSGGGQPVSLQNAREVSEICKKHQVLFVLDCCRIAENAYFIKHREEGVEDKTYREIAQEVFTLCDGAIMSAKKDAIVNMGGFLALKDEELANACTNLLIITEGYTTYGGLSGRDMEAITVGLQEVFRADYLHYRIRSTTYLGEKLQEMGVPVLLPIGGHAVYIDARAFYPLIPVNEYPGQVLACELYLKGGIRSCEIGSVMFGKYDENHQLISSAMDLVRLAIPRRVYTQSHIDYVIETFSFLMDDRNKHNGFKIDYEPELLRHFTCRFSEAKPT
ncbi:MAG: tryptophanase [Bacteroidetes bacterium]|nr:tryptophanase [Bacteroidota bacterium]